MRVLIPLSSIVQRLTMPRDAPCDASSGYLRHENRSDSQRFRGILQFAALRCGPSRERRTHVPSAADGLHGNGAEMPRKDRDARREYHREYQRKWYQSNRMLHMERVTRVNKRAREAINNYVDAV